MKLMKETRQMLSGFDPWRKAEWALGLLSLISSCFAVSVVPFLRRDMGERYFGWLNLFFGYTVVANFTFLGSIFFGEPSRLMNLFWLAFVGASLYQRWQIAQKNASGVQWHSMYMGTSLLPLPVSAEKIFKFVEPAIVLAAAHFLSPFSSQVGWWLTFAAGGLFVNNHIVYYNERLSAVELTGTKLKDSWRVRVRRTIERNRVARFLQQRATALADYWRRREGMEYA